MYRADVRPHHLPVVFFFRVFLQSFYSLYRFGGLLVWVLWVGSARHPWLDDEDHVKIEVFDVGGWLTHGNYAGDVDVDFFEVVEHRLTPARVR